MNQPSPYIRVIQPFLLGAALLAAVPVVADEGEHAQGEAHKHPEVLRSGHVDILVLLDSEEGLHLALAAEEEGHEHAHGEEASAEDGDGHHHDHLELNQARIVAGAAATLALPSTPGFAFLGQPGRYVFVLPQSEVAGLPFVGLNTEELDPAAILGDVQLELVSVDGPGTFFLYETDSFGQPRVLLDGTATPGQSLALSAGIHRHANWAFSQPGQYELGFVLSATLAGGTTLRSNPQILQVEVTGSARLYSEGHANLAFLDFSEEHGLEVAFVIDSHAHQHDVAGQEAPNEEEDDHGHGTGSAFHPADVITVLGGYALTAVPDNPLFAFLGEPGAPLFLVSSTPVEGTPFFGFVAENLPTGVLAGPLELSLHAVEGPGHVFLYTIDAGGLPTLLWNSRGPASAPLTLPAGSHLHANIAFTQPGAYTLHLDVEAPLASGSKTQAAVTLTFAVGGLEGFFSHFDRPFPQWLHDHSGKWFQTSAWPLVWSPGEGWLYASGNGGPTQYFYAYARQGWILTNPDSGLNAFDFNSSVWTPWGN